MTMRSPALALLLAACITIPARAHAQVEGGDALTATMGFMDALNSLDIDRLSGYFAPTVTAFVPLARAERVEGKEALVAIFRAFVERTRLTTARLNLVPEDVEMVSNGPLAIVTFNVRDAAAGQVRRRTFVWQRKGGAWLMRHMHASDLAPPAG